MFTDVEEMNTEVAPHAPLWIRSGSGEGDIDIDIGMCISLSCTVISPYSPYISFYHLWYVFNSLLCMFADDNNMEEEEEEEAPAPLIMRLRRGAGEDWMEENEANRELIVVLQDCAGKCIISCIFPSLLTLSSPYSAYD